MSAEEDGRSGDDRERRGDGGRRNSPPRRGGDARGGPGGSGARKGGGPRGGAPRGGGSQGGRGRPGGGWKDRESRGERDDRKPGRPFKRSDDRRGDSRQGRPGGPRGERRDDRFGKERGDKAGERRDGRPGGPRAGGGQGGQGKRRFQDRDERRPGGRRFEGKREGRPGDRERPFKGRGERSYGPPRGRADRRARSDERERPAPRHDDPLLPDDVTGEELDAEARAGLRSLPKDLAAKVARHLVMAGRLADEEPERAYKHARAARRLASRVGIVREAAGIAAYHAGEWAEALAELRAARRLGAGDDSYLPVMADCERGLGRPERALDLIKSPEAKSLDPMGRIELRIVESGVRRDLGQHDAAVVTLQIPELRDRRLRPWSVRLFYAYADALAEAGRRAEASDWFARAAAADRDGDTDAAERYAELEGLHIVDTEEGEVEEHHVREGEARADLAEVDETTADAGPADAGGVGEGLVDMAGVDEVTVDLDQPEERPEEQAATDIEFKPAEAEPSAADEADDGAPKAPAVFLEPKPADEERPPPAD